MSLSPQEREACVAELADFMKERRPPLHLRDQVDLRYRINQTTLILYEVRPAWDGRGDVIERPFAKLTLIRSRHVWKLYWMRTSGKWQAYEPDEYRSLIDVLSVVRLDEFGCFFG